LITGGSGFLGQHLADWLKGNHEVFISSRNQKQMMSAAQHLGVEAVPLDVSNYPSTIEIFQRIRPQVVIHAAATKFVGLAEKFPNEAIDINIVGSQNVARAAMQTGVRDVIGISTDKAAAPIFNLYGLTKATMERLFTSLDGLTDTRFSSVRYGNVAWSTGSVFPIWRKMLTEKNHIVSTGADMSRFFFSVNDAVKLVGTAVENMEIVGGRILSLPMKGTELSRVLDVWTNMTGATWSRGDRRAGDRELEYLLSEDEGNSTKRIQISDGTYFLLDPKVVGSIENSFGNEFSSRSAEQFTDREIEELIINLPDMRFL
jgi:FlaA1/EpsC-like NDP-sugar epimerase